MIELKDKFKNMTFAAKAKTTIIGRVYAGGDHREIDALQVLLSLGYSESVAAVAVNFIITVLFCSSVIGKSFLGSNARSPLSLWSIA